jgi:uncharacterized caspase-like protein
VVGINDYSKSKPVRKPAGAGPPRGLFGDLQSARNDAEAMREHWRRAKDPLYQQADIVLLPGKDGLVRRDDVLKALHDLSGRVGPDDQVLLFLAGHGDLHQDGDESTFVFCCSDYDRDRYGETGVTSRDLYEALARIPCRKVVFLDACRSGDAALNPVRDLTPGGKGPTILAACDRSQFSFEDPELKHGLFTWAILEALGDRFAQADQNHDDRLDAEEIFAYARARVPPLLRKLKVDRGQTPVRFPREPERYPLLGKVSAADR